MFTNRSSLLQSNFRYGFISWDGSCHPTNWPNGWNIYLGGGDLNAAIYVDPVPSGSPGSEFGYSGAQLVLDNNGGPTDWVNSPWINKPISPVDVDSATVLQWTQFDLDHSLLFAVDVEGIDGVRRNLIYGANASNHWGDSQMVNMTGSPPGYNEWLMYTRNLNTDYLVEYGLAARRIHAFGIGHYNFAAWDGDHGGTIGGVCVGACAPDGDFDTVSDEIDNCSAARNLDQANNDPDFIELSPPKAFDDLTRANSDALGDACDDDDDNDGLTDAEEGSGAACGGVVTNALVADGDGDLYLDGAECSLGTDPTNVTSKPLATACGVATDGDGDKFVDRFEVCFYNTNVGNADTDGDGCVDGKEIASINGDRAVSSIDLSQIAQSFGPYALPASAVNANFDMNKDGSISSIDLSLVAQNFGPC